jgi:hypothetical protein
MFVHFECVETLLLVYALVYALYMLLLMYSCAGHSLPA